ncbi:hypothetical protein OFL47_15315, partial [Pseudomonas aeruginosa]
KAVNATLRSNRISHFFRRPPPAGGRGRGGRRPRGGRRCGGKVMDNLLFYVSSAFVSLLLAWNLFACWRRQRPPEKSRP